MALWDVHQSTTYLGGPDMGRTTTHYIGVIDDTQNLPSQGVLDWFGNGERNDVQVTSPQDGIIEAKIQYAPQNRSGWARDRETPFEYVVLFRGVRR